MNTGRAGLIVSVGIALLSAGHPSFAQGYLGLGPAQNAASYREMVGQKFSFVCPAGDGSKASVYGTDTYTDGSAVCAAAIHAGALKAGHAGVVTILIGGGAKSFRGSERNGVTTLSYDRAWAYTYSFAREADPGNITWSTVWNGIPEDFTDPIVVNCPAGGMTDRTIWGTDVYTRDSTICVAAAHTGSITPEKGGLITVRRARAPKEYPGTQRFRITSQRWGSSADAFSVAAAQTAAPPPPPPPTPNALSRTLALTGITGVGSASQAGPIASRTIALAGFTGVGSAPSPSPISPRTIHTPGWTGVGSAP